MPPTTLLSVCLSVNKIGNPKHFQIHFNETLRNFTACNEEEQIRPVFWTKVKVKRLRLTLGKEQIGEFKLTSVSVVIVCDLFVEKSCGFSYGECVRNSNLVDVVCCVVCFSVLVVVTCGGLRY